jgi:hypothetical protein
MRFINSGAAGETLTATPTTPDEFVFKNPATGPHTITGLHTINGFDLTRDVIELSAAQFPTGFTGVTNAMTAMTGSNVGSTSISLGGTSSLVLSGVTKASLLLSPSSFALT